MQAVSFSILRWSAWAPGLDSAEQWAAWARGETAVAESGAPAVDFVPPLLRRRLSELSKAALSVAFRCAQPGEPGEHRGRTVFASSQGEIHRTQRLLDDLARGEPLSPNAFSLSVHNTASGLYAIAGGQRAPSTAVAAGVETLEMAVIEALGALRHGAERAVMVVLAEEPLPDRYQAWSRVQPARFALALLLAPAAEDNVWRLSRRSGPPPARPGEAHGLGLLRLLTGARHSLTLPGERAHWCWERL